MSEELKKELAHSRILISGGLGFVGSAIAHRLLREGVGEIVLFDVQKEIPSILKKEWGKGRLHFLAGDLRNPDDVEKAVRGCQYVFHEAAIRVTRCAKEPRIAYEVLVGGTFNLVLAAAQQGVKKLIHASSCVIYGEPLYLPLDEKHPSHDLTTYGICKIANEDLLRSFQKQFGLNYLALRYFNIYGPGMNLFGPEVEVLIRWLDRLDAGLAPLIFGDGKQTLDWIFIDDIAEANWRALVSPLSGETLNICTGRETNLLQVLDLLQEIRGTKLAPEFREGRAVNQVSRRFGFPEKASRLLNFRAQISLEEGLKQFVEWRDRVLMEKGKEKASQFSR